MKIKSVRRKLVIKEFVTAAWTVAIQHRPIRARLWGSSRWRGLRALALARPESSDPPCANRRGGAR